MSEAQITDEMVQRALAVLAPRFHHITDDSFATQVRSAIEAALSGMAEPVAWAFFGRKGYEHFLRTGDRGFISDISVVPEFVERKSKEHDVTVPLFATPPASGLREENERLRKAIKRLILGYVSTMEAGRDRIMSLGGTCDPVDVMEASDPHLIEARAALQENGGE
jgi:hypothetical protein